MKNITLCSFLFIFTIITNNAWAEEAQSSNQSAPGNSLDKQHTTSIYLSGQEPESYEKWKEGTSELNSSGKRLTDTSFTAGIGDTVVVYLSEDDKKTLINNASCLTRDIANKSICSQEKIALYLDGRDIAERKYDDLVNADYIEFKLAYEEDPIEGWNNKSKWNELLGAPTWGKGFFKKPVNSMVGFANTYNIGNMINVDPDHKFLLRRIATPLFFLGMLGLIALLWVIFKYAPDSSLLRNGDKTTPWSMARCQMAFWFILIIYSFLFVWGITGALDTITSQTLVMMGLSSGTLLGAALIDISRDEDSRLKEIQAAIQKFANDNATLASQLPVAGTDKPSFAVAGIQALISENDRRINLLTQEVNSFKELNQTTGHFWDDILSDREGGPALHRFQIVAWTIVLGFIFIYSVWKDLTMPAFSNTLLSLMGLSSATYLGFKVPENKQ